MTDWGKIGVFLGGLIVIGLFINYIEYSLTESYEMQESYERNKQEIQQLQEENDQLQWELQKAQMRADIMEKVKTGELGPPKSPEIPIIEFKSPEYELPGFSPEERIVQELEEMNRRQMYENMYDEIDEMFNN